MKPQKIETSGAIDKNGNLNMFMGELNEFFKKNKGYKVLASFTVLKPNCSVSFRGFYYLHVVPIFKQALWDSGDRKTEEETDLFLCEISPVTKRSIVDPETGKYVNEVVPVAKLNNAELSEHVEYIRQLAAEEYGVIIEDPTPFKPTN